MAGSYAHITKDDGTFSGIDLIENLGDAHEALEECHWIINYLTGGQQGSVKRVLQMYNLQPSRKDGTWGNEPMYPSTPFREPEEES